MKKLSIITICLNEKNKIEKTINSVVSQSFNDFEYIIIDGGSSDGTVEVISKFISKLSYFCSEKDNGIYSAMNKGIEHTHGEYLLFLNGGDYLNGNNVLQKIFQNMPNEDIIFGDLIFKESSSEESLKSFKDVKINKRYLYNFYIPHSASLIKRDLFLKYGLYNSHYKIAGDYEFFLRVINKYKAIIRYIPVAISVFDTTGISSDPKYFKLQIKERRRAQIQYFNYVFLFRMLLLKVRRVLFK
ncbi:MAG TPA: glycosyltransferase family 2 protein [Candidatus Paceibacterota bacterium]